MVLYNWVNIRVGATMQPCNHTSGWLGGTIRVGATIVGIHDTLMVLTAR